MGTIKLNPDNLKKKIKGLRDKSDEAGRARGSIDTESERLGDPSPSKAVDTFCNNSATHIDNVRTCADQIESEMNRIIELNQSGVATMNGGTITVENVPDTVLKGGKNEFDTWSQGALDAKDLQTITGGGTPKSGRSYDEVIASMSTYKDNPSYSVGLIDTIGPENLTQLPLDLDKALGLSSRHDANTAIADQRTLELINILGEVLANASSKWDENKSQEIANKIVGSVNGYGHYGRITVLNAILDGNDADHDHINDLKFDKTFLVDMAKGLEEIDPNEVKKYYGYLNSNNTNLKSLGRDYVGKYLTNQSRDPLSGVLSAMGNNPDAALDFLAPQGIHPDGNPGADTTRLFDLSKRDWDEAGLSGFTAAIAAGSSKRGGTEGATRADDLSGFSIKYLVDNTNKDLYNDDTKAHIGQLLANCAPEVTNAWVEGGVYDPKTRKYLPGFQPSSNGDLSHYITDLAYTVADNEDATGTIAAGLAEHARQRSQESIAGHKTDADKLAGIHDAYTQGAEAVGLLTGLADQKYNNGKEESSKSANAAVNIFTDVALTGVSAWGGPAATAIDSTAGQLIKPAVTTLTKPIVASAVADATGSSAVQVPEENSERSLWAASVQDAANAGLLDERDFTAPGSNTYTWIKQKDDGSHYIDLSNTHGTKNSEVTDWVNSVQSPDPEGDPEEAERPRDDKLDKLGDDFKGTRADARDRGISEGRKRG